MDLEKQKTQKPVPDYVNLAKVSWPWIILLALIIRGWEGYALLWFFFVIAWL